MTKTGYYVTAIDGKRVAWLCGPFETHGAALAMVAPVTRAALDLGVTNDPRFAFAAFGTTRLEALILPAGKLDLARAVDDAWIAHVTGPQRP